MEELLESGQLGEYSYQIVLNEYGEIYFTVTEPIGEVVDSGSAKTPERAMDLVRLACS